MFRLKAWPLMVLLGACVALVGCGNRKPQDAKAKPTGQASDKTVASATISLEPPPALVSGGSASTEVAVSGVKITSDKGAALVQNAGESTYKVVDKDSLLSVGQRLLSPNGATVVANGLEVVLRGDLSGKSPLPVLESALVLRKPSAPGIDLEFEFERGRVDLANTKATGDAKVRIHAFGAFADLELRGPGSRCAAEVYGRFLPGTRFDANATVPARPSMRMVLVVIKGEVGYSDHDSFLRLSQPPGRAMLNFDGDAGAELSPSHLDKVPAWVLEDPKDPEVAKHLAMVKDLEGKFAATGDISAVIDDFAKSDDPSKRLAAVNMAAAVDDLPRLIMIISSSPHPDVIDEGIVALRHWLGRAQGQDQKFHDMLVKGLPDLAKISGKPELGKPATSIQATSFLELLYGFDDEHRDKPSTYAYLLKLLRSDRPALRGLSAWYLSHQVPEGVRFGFNATAAADVREIAVKQWEQRLSELKKLPEVPVKKPLPVKSKP